MNNLKCPKCKRVFKTGLYAHLRYSELMSPFEIQEVLEKSQEVLENPNSGINLVILNHRRLFKLKRKLLMEVFNG